MRILLLGLAGTLGTAVLASCQTVAAPRPRTDLTVQYDTSHQSRAVEGSTQLLVSVRSVLNATSTIPSPDVTLYADSGRAAIELRQVRADSTGQVVFDGLRPGLYTVRARRLLWSPHSV